MKSKMPAATDVSKRVVLGAHTAEDLMTPNPVSISEHALVREAAAVLTDREIGAVTVINDAGRPVGVLSRTDIVRHDREKSNDPVLGTPEDDEMTLLTGERVVRIEIEATDPTLVREIMTPMVVSVELNESSLEVVAKMLAFKLHRLFVVDGGVLVGVISTFDVLGKLRGEE